MSSRRPDPSPVGGVPDSATKPQPPMMTTTEPALGNHTGTWRAFRPVYVQHTPPCRETCPAGEDIARWMDLLRSGRIQEAWLVLVEDNPFPATMGRICIHPCEGACNRGQHDAPMAINGLEQFLGDRALEAGWPLPGPQIELRQRVAIVGAGPAGLSCAFQLRRMGYQVTMLEAGPEAGGNLTKALPGYQLPPGVARAEVRRILDLGVDLRTGVRVENDDPFSWSALLRDHDAVYLATGAPQIWKLDMPGSDLPGVVDGVRFVQTLRQVLASGQRPDPGALDLMDGKPPVQVPAPGAPAVVIGAGLTGIESARLLRRLGAGATLITAEPEDSLMLPERVAEAVAEGVTLYCSASAQALVAAADGAVAGVQVGGQVLPATCVVVATGRIPDLETLPADCQLDGWNVAADPLTGETGIPGLFAGGDVTGTRYAVEAIGAGKRAAAAIDAHMQGQRPAEALRPARLGHSANLAMRYYRRPESYPDQVRVDLGRTITYQDINTLYFHPAARAERSLRPAADRLLDFDEVRHGFSETEARAETQRCFNCGTCIQCDNCLMFCPDMAITKTPDGVAFNVNWDYCKGCGACVHECPREALILEEEIK